MLKNYDITITDKISLHFGQEPLWYLIPTLGYQRLDWRNISADNKISYLFVIKFLNLGVGIVYRKNIKYKNKNGKRKEQKISSII